MRGGQRWSRRHDETRSRLDFRGICPWGRYLAGRRIRIRDASPCVRWAPSFVGPCRWRIGLAGSQDCAHRQASHLKIAAPVGGLLLSETGPDRPLSGRPRMSALPGYFRRQSVAKGLGDLRRCRRFPSREQCRPARRCILHPSAPPRASQSMGLTSRASVGALDTRLRLSHRGRSAP
jgi:hypothetical protein